MINLPTRSLLVVCTIFLAGCGSLRSAKSPDLSYGKDAVAATELQVPPDLTDISNTEQYILPGTPGALVTRNTLLPQFDSVRFVRQGAQSWLAFDQSPENIWQKVLSFTRKEKFLIEKTQPIAGSIVTQWRPASAVAKGSLLKNLMGSDEAYTRVAFRIERSGSGARLFARSQKAADKTVTEANSQWPASSHDPENTSALLLRLLTFLGVEEQKAAGILSREQADAVLDDATLQTNGSGTDLVLYQGYQPAFRAVLIALDQLKHPVSSRDDGVGRIEFTEEGSPMVIELTPVHFSEVRIGVRNAEGLRLESEEELIFLKSLYQRLV
jgi:outer membrane protein assembly factor BamC